MEKNLLIDFGNRLKKLRKEKGLTQQNMADMMGITMRNYQRYEYGDINVPATTLNFFADYFGVTTDYLLGREQ
ncbi:MAG: helix-turn-helix transcriptional regulator [Lawsonibacter sp.]|nr:helix-turn-helix transcriptional regulator [Lawsonibacter sp.]